MRPQFDTLLPDRAAGPRVIPAELLVRGTGGRVTGDCSRARNAPAGSVLILRALHLSSYDSVVTAAAVICSSGGLTGHMQSLCRAKGIPVLRVSAAELAELDGPVTVDADAACVITGGGSPAQARAEFSTEGVTTDRLGSVCVVIADLADIGAVNATAGLSAESFFIREEFLALAHSLRPIDALAATPRDAAGYGTAVGGAVRRLANALDPGQRIVFRLLDLRSDDAARLSTGTDADPEVNPELGLHGARWLARSAHYPVAFAALVEELRTDPAAAAAVTFAVPFVNDPEEFTRVRAHVGADDVPLAAFVETPAAVHSAPALLAAGASELFVGTKDLVQFYLAADRGSHLVSDSYRTRHPAVMDALSRLAAGSLQSGTRVRIFSLGADLAHYVKHLPRPYGFMMCAAEFRQLSALWAAAG